MFARELAGRVSGTGVTVCSLHPGTVYTELTRYLFTGWLIILKVRSSAYNSLTPDKYQAVKFVVIVLATSAKAKTATEHGFCQKFED